MTIYCIACIREGGWCQAVGTDSMVPRRDGKPARPAITVANGDALCEMHLKAGAH